MKKSKHRYNNNVIIMTLKNKFKQLHYEQY